MDSVDDRTRELDRHALADPVGSAAPTRVDEPDLGTVLLHVCLEQFGVLGRMPNEERFAKTRRERRLRLFNANFGSGDLCGITADEVVHCLIGRQLADRWKNAERIAGKEDDVLGMAALASFFDVLDVVDRIGSAGVFGQRIVVIIDVASRFVEDGVFENGSELDGVINLRFAFSGKMDALRIATAFDVDNAFVGPVMLVVADELAARLSGEGRLARSGKTEEQAGVARLAFVGRAVHRKEALLRHEIIHDREDALLHLARVLGSENDKLAALEVDIDGGRGSKGFSRRIGDELTRIEDDDVRSSKVGEFFFSRTDQHVVHEERVIGASADNAHFDAVFRIPTGESVDDIKVIASVQVVDSASAVLHERRFGHLLVDRSPPDVLIALGIVDDTLVFRAAPRLFSGGIHQGASGRDGGVFKSNRVLVKLRGNRVAINVADGDSVLL